MGHGGAEGDGTPRPLRPVAGDGACREHASATKGVLEPSAHRVDGLVLATGVPQIDLLTIEGCRGTGCEGDR